MIETAVQVKERPILFSGEMVRAVLSGRKTQTRRVMKPQPPPGSYLDEISLPRFSASFWDGESEKFIDIDNPYGKPGDRLWVRERWASFNEPTEQEQRTTDAILNRFFAGRSKDIVGDDLSIPVGTGKVRVLYASDFGDWADDPDSDLHWKSPRFMPRWASRITLEIVNVRVERVQEISFHDCLSEGIVSTQYWEKCKGETIPDDLAGPNGDIDMDRGWEAYAREAFRDLWDSINGKKYPWKSNPWVWAIEFKRLEAT